MPYLTQTRTDISCPIPNNTRWLEQIPTYFIASWKTIPFYCESSSDEFGRRGDSYEYPLSNDVGYKDLGRKARHFKLEGYLLGNDQMDRTREIVNKVEEEEPGWLIHPLYGPQLVACVTLATSIDYKKARKRTKLSFEFIEAMPSYAPYQVGMSMNKAFEQAGQAILESMLNGQRDFIPDNETNNAGLDISMEIAKEVAPAPPADEPANDAISYVSRGAGGRRYEIGGVDMIEVSAPLVRIAAPRATMEAEGAGAQVMYRSFASIAEPINYASATIRRIHLDALERLRRLNAFVVNRTEGMMFNPSVAALVITTRLILVRDMGLTMALKSYQTIKEALDDLDLIMQIYDEEEIAAAQKCDDALVVAIRATRATVASIILSRNIRLPGIASFPTNGLWPSLVVAHKLYGNGRRYQDVENYNAAMPTFWMGRDVIAPTR